MIELVFGESAGGALKLAKSMKYGEVMACAVGVIGGTKEDRRKANTTMNWLGLTMSGSSKDVAPLSLMLDIGDISDMEGDMKSRQQLLLDFYGNLHNESDLIWQSNLKTLFRLREAKVSLEPVRIWVSANNPAELCGLYFMCHFMLGGETPLSVVWVPTEIEYENNVISHCCTGEIVPELFGVFQEYEESLSLVRCVSYAHLWDNIVFDNLSLRAVINGSLIGVPDDFYDFALRSNIPEGEFNVGMLIGKTLGSISGVGDHWLFLRVQHMIQLGELVIVSAEVEDNPYSAVIKRSVE